MKPENDRKDGEVGDATRDGSEVGETVQGRGDAGAAIALRAGLPPKDLEEMILGMGRHTDVGHRALAFYLNDLDVRRVYQLFGFSRSDRYAECRLDMSRRQARDLIATGRALLELGQVDAAFLKGAISWSKARLLARIAVPETEEAWLERAMVLSCRKLEREVAQGEKGKPPRTDGRGLPHVRLKIQVDVDAVVHELWEQARRRIRAEQGEEVSDAEVLRLMAEQSLRRPALEGSEEIDPSVFRVIVDRCEDCGRAELRTDDGPVALDEVVAEEVSRGAPVQSVPEASGKPSEDTSDLVRSEGIDAPATERERREILARDGFCCQACGSRIGLHAHHIIWRCLGGKTTPENMLAVCTACHALIHGGLLSVLGRAPRGVSFRDREGRPLDAPRRKTPCADLVIAPSRGARAPTPELVRLGTIPAEVDASWWRDHRHLTSWNPPRGLFHFEEGLPKSAAQDEGTGLGNGAVEAQGSDAPGEGTSGNRPRRLGDIVGQERIVRSLEEATAAAKKRGAAVAHVLLQGPAGLGKTTFARAVAAEMGRGCTVTSGPAIESPAALIGYLTALEEGDVLFVDEVHAMPRRVAEMLYQAMEDGKLSLTLQSEAELETRSITVWLPAFTLVAATTDPDRMPPPLIARFHLREDLLPYGEREIIEIMKRAADREKVEVSGEALEVLARAAHGTPREALRLMMRLRDRLVAHVRTVANRGVAEELLRDLGIDEHGLGPVPRRAMEILRKSRHPLGRRRLASLLSLSSRTFTETCEPPLLRSGLVRATPRGLVAGAG